VISFVLFAKKYPAGYRQGKTEHTYTMKARFAILPISLYWIKDIFLSLENRIAQIMLSVNKFRAKKRNQSGVPFL